MSLLRVYLLGKCRAEKRDTGRKRGESGVKYIYEYTKRIIIMVQKSLQITEKQNDWLKTNHIKFSALVREHLEEKMALHGQHNKNMETEDESKPPSVSRTPTKGVQANESHTSL